MLVKMAESEIRHAVGLAETGMSPEAIAGELGYAPRTVRRHLVEEGVISGDSRNPETAMRQRIQWLHAQVAARFRLEIDLRRQIGDSMTHEQYAVLQQFHFELATHAQELRELERHLRNLDNLKKEKRTASWKKRCLPISLAVQERLTPAIERRLAEAAARPADDFVGHTMLAQAQTTLMP